MAKNPLRKDETDLLNDLFSETPENVQVICKQIDAGKSPIQIWRLLKNNFKNNRNKYINSSKTN